MQPSRSKNASLKQSLQTAVFLKDIKYLSDDTILTLGLSLAQTGIKQRTPNPAFVVTPLNDIKGNMKNFDWAYDHLANLAFKVESNDGPKTIELKKYTGETEDILKQIDADGFVPAPSPYVLGLGVQHPAVIKEYGYIVSLDEKNVLLFDGGSPCFLRLRWCDGRNLNLARRAGRWVGFWWFAVVRKSSLFSCIIFLQEFLFEDLSSNHRAFYLFLLVRLRVPYIVLKRYICFPTQSGGRTVPH